MEDKYIAILGGLFGSAFTIIVTKVFEYFQAFQTHKLALKKEFFLRKINVYEKAVSQMNIAHITIINMATLVRSGQKASFADEQSKEIFTRLDSNIQTIYKSTQETAGAIDLYIDFQHDDKEVEDVQKYWELLASISETNQDITMNYDLLKKVTTQKEYTKIESEIKLQEGTVAQNIESLFNLSKSVRGKLLSMTATLRKELKKYD